MDTGVRFSLDDFGIGYSSISHVRDIPVAEIKLDRSYISSFLEIPADRVIVEALIHMGQSLGLRVVAEGVETMEQLAALSELGCHVAQGYLIGPAASSRDALKVLIGKNTNFSEIYKK
ncbi:Phytochrome-like protein cph2 [compost metagenome]